MSEFRSFYLDDPLQTGRVFDLFTAAPDVPEQQVAVFFIHGGGWRNGSRQKFHSIMEAFGKRGFITASTDYRLYARDAFEQLSDVRAAYSSFATWIRNSGRQVKIAVFGESAGAHLASLLVCAAPGACGEKNDFSDPWVKPVMGILQATPVDFLPWDGMMPQTWSMMQNIAGVPYDQAPEVYGRLSLKNYISPANPPLFFMEAELENMFLSEHTAKVAELHRQWGINTRWKCYEKMEHGFFYELKRRAQLEAFEDICTILQQLD